MSIPPFAPFPEAKLRGSILPKDWILYLKSWDTLAELYLRLNDRDFISTLKESSSLTNFLISFFHESALDPTLASSTVQLRKKCFLILHRVYSGQEISEGLLDCWFISDVCHTFPKSERLRILLQSLWQRSGSTIEISLQKAKSSLIKVLDSKRPRDAEPLLDRLGPLLKVAPDADIFMLTGSDFLDSLSAAYAQASVKFQKKLVTTAYLGLTALLQGQKPNYSLLSDHLYSLKTGAEQAQKREPTISLLLTDLVTNTPLLEKIRDIATSPEATRVKNTAASLSAFQQSGVARPKNLIRRKVDKGKEKAKDDEYGHGAFSQVHVHRMSLVTQVQDLFPDLGSGFVVRLLDEYNDNVEEVITRLLEDSLPTHLANADRSEQL
jgi:activating signal cointegrator complex subunit 2